MTITTTYTVICVVTCIGTCISTCTITITTTYAIICTVAFIIILAFFNGVITITIGISRTTGCRTNITAAMPPPGLALRACAPVGTICWARLRFRQRLS